MDRPLGLLLALLVVATSVSVVASDRPSPADPVVSVPGTAEGVGAGATVDPNGTVSRLPVGNGTAVSGFATPEPDLGAAVSFGDAEFGSQIGGYSAVQRLEAAPNESAKQAVIRNSLDAVQAGVEELRAAESAAVRAYHQGEIDAAALLRRLGRIDARAGSLQKSVSYLRSEGQNAGGFTYQLRTRSLWIKQDLGTFEARIRDRINRTFRGSAEGTRVHVVASADGFALETIVDGVYVRDAVRFDNYEPNDAPSVGADDVIQLVERRYPSLNLNPKTPNNSGSLSLDPPIGQRLWRLVLQYPQGTSTVYFDQSSGEVYREVHHLELDDLPTRTVAESDGEDVRVVVNRTDEGNPYLVRTLDPLTEAPVDATVTVGGTEVGSTGEDGRLWTLGPRGGFEVGVATGSETVNVSVPG